MLFLGRLCFRWREHVCVEQVLAAPACYFAVLAAGKKLMCRLLILLVSREKEECHPFDIIFYGPLLLPAESALLVLGVALLLWHWRHPAAFLILTSGLGVLLVGGTLVAY